MFFSINGYTQSVYFPLMLMDIMNNSKDLANIARSVTDNMGALGWVFYLFICTVVIYAQVKQNQTENKRGRPLPFLMEHSSRVVYRTPRTIASTCTLVYV
jgi:hypothetical protein